MIKIGYTAVDIEDDIRTKINYKTDAIFTYEIEDFLSLPYTLKDYVQNLKDDIYRIEVGKIRKAIKERFKKLV